ncbi:hypothetical protein PN36_11965 [Candidatus Thiomargarita nelsonii]|uniref:Uncharacterized protein n=1 Tax=Candidatus Thiomargarita nelsonii TaxID=1003181 RepID=A0A4E0QVW8_9GAMM|nr:hypothetical protein PN36_11965 [Candidatus Thiomargarita nelsonii]
MEKSQAKCRQSSAWTMWTSGWLQTRYVAFADNRRIGAALSNAAGTAHWKEGDAFSHVQMKRYWSSSPITSRPGAIWSLNMRGRLDF